MLYDALDLPDLHRRGVATDHVLIFSGLWGVVRPNDRIPHFAARRVKVSASGSVSAAWRKALRTPLAAHVGDQLVVDLRSVSDAPWAPGGNAVTVRVLHDGSRRRGHPFRGLALQQGDKGRLTRALLESDQQPRKPDEFADLVRALGYTVERGTCVYRPDAPAALDIVVREL